MVRFTQIKGIPDYRAGLGYSPGSGPKVGGPIYPPGYFYGDNIDDLLPRVPSKFGFGTNYVNLRTFPQLGAFLGEVGLGNTPGGIGGINGPILYGVNTLEARQMSYGKRHKRRKSKTRKRRKSKVRRRRSTKKGRKKKS